MDPSHAGIGHGKAIAFPFPYYTGHCNVSSSEIATSSAISGVIPYMQLVSGEEFAARAKFFPARACDRIE